MFSLPQRRRIYLMRHGEAAYVAEDGTVTSDPRNVPLTATGREQAQCQGQILSEIVFDRAICSGLPRTRETIELVMAQQSQPPQPAIEELPQLEEIHGLKGDREWPPADGQTVASVLQDIANPWAKGEQKDSQFLGGERFTDFTTRVVNQWQAIIADTSWNNLLMVLHGAVNRAIFNHTLHLPWSAEFCIEQDNACLNIIDVDSTRPLRYLIRTANLTAYNLVKEGISATNMESTAMRIAQTLQADKRS